MTGCLLPLKVAAERLGLSPRTLRNKRWARRAGLPVSGPMLPLVEQGRRLFVRETDLDRYIETLAAPVEPRQAALTSIADAISKIFPDEAAELRRLALEDLP